MGQCTSKQQAVAVITTAQKDRSVRSSTSASDYFSAAGVRRNAGRASVNAANGGDMNKMTEISKSDSAYQRSKRRSSIKRCSSSRDMRESSKSASTHKRRLSIDNIEKIAESSPTPDEPDPSLSVVALTPAPKSRGRSMRTLPYNRSTPGKSRSTTPPPPLGKMPGASRGARPSIQICEIGQPTKPSLDATKESSWFKLSCSDDVNGGNMYDSYKHNTSQSSMQSSSASVTAGEGKDGTPVAGTLSRNNKNALGSMIGICFTESEDENEDDTDSDDEDIEGDVPRSRKLVSTSELLLQETQESGLPSSWVQ